MKLNRVLPMLALAASLTFVQFAVAQQTLSPSIQSVHVECRVANGQTHTVRVVMTSNPSVYAASAIYNYRYSFQNSGTGQVSTFYLGPMLSPTLTTFPLMAGNYNLTVALSTTGVANAPALPGHAMAVYNNIKVPATVSTHGRGTGCEFASAINRPNQIAPGLKPQAN